MTTVMVLNGPNLNLLGRREPAVYGSATLSDVEESCLTVATELGWTLDFRQSNREGELIDWIQEGGQAQQTGELVGAVFNPGAYTHTSIALHDAIAGSEITVIELHISNIHRRETFRHRSYISPVAAGIIVGLGVAGYPLALRALAAIS